MPSSIVRRYVMFFGIVLSTALCAAGPGCTSSDSGTPMARTVPLDGDWGIYTLDLNTLETGLVYSCSDEIQSSALRLNRAGDTLVFAAEIDGTDDANLEIFSVGIDGANLTRLTTNTFWDLYPVWSPDGTQIAFLSRREEDLDIHIMDSSGTGARRLYDSGFHDADIDWAGDSIVFTSRFSIWRTDADGAYATRLTDPPGRGEWGSANLPRGDYDPRLSPDGRKIVFERLEDTSIPNGGYNLFVINSDGTGETRLTENGCSQGLASWSHSGDRIVYVVAAVDGQGKYDIYMMDSDGTDNRNITPPYFPAGFLCHAPVFSADDSSLFFIGQWWQQPVASRALDRKHDLLFQEQLAY